MSINIYIIIIVIGGIIRYRDYWKMFLIMGVVALGLYNMILFYGTAPKVQNVGFGEEYKYVTEMKEVPTELCSSYISNHLSGLEKKNPQTIQINGEDFIYHSASGKVTLADDSSAHLIVRYAGYKETKDPTTMVLFIDAEGTKKLKDVEKAFEEHYTDEAIEAAKKTETSIELSESVGVNSDFLSVGSDHADYVSEKYILNQTKNGEVRGLVVIPEIGDMDPLYLDYINWEYNTIDYNYKLGTDRDYNFVLMNFYYQSVSASPKFNRTIDELKSIDGTPIHLGKVDKDFVAYTGPIDDAGEYCFIAKCVCYDVPEYESMMLENFKNILRNIQFYHDNYEQVTAAGPEAKREITIADPEGSFDSVKFYCKPGKGVWNRTHLESMFFNSNLAIVARVKPIDDANSGQPMMADDKDFFQYYEKSGKIEWEPGPIDYAYNGGIMKVSHPTYQYELQRLWSAATIVQTEGSQFELSILKSGCPEPSQEDMETLIGNIHDSIDVVLAE